ncbi:hypothetical protein HAX54_018079 [Datura stramonium]|uniref:Uncharacterized protein n=1 Tax=Datura stramonium TaxID=4076 RepID=A0ABS8S1G1_DATST|nr:hypothetical protein [Datura stramonium]
MLPMATLPEEGDLSRTDDEQSTRTGELACKTTKSTLIQHNVILFNNLSPRGLTCQNGEEDSCLYNGRTTINKEGHRIFLLKLSMTSTLSWNIRGIASQGAAERLKYIKQQ